MKYFAKVSEMSSSRSSKKRLWFCGVQTIMFALCIFGILLTASANATDLVSINSDGTDSGNGVSGGSVFSANGRFVAFASNASNLVATDTNGRTDVFVRDLETGITTLVSVNRAGTDSGNGFSRNPVISDNSRFVAFESNASDLVVADTNKRRNVFVRDLQTEVTTLVSVNSARTNGGNDTSRNPVISGDGRFVTFQSFASDLVVTDTNGTGDVFMRDIQAGTTTLVSVNMAGTDSSNGISGNPVFSANGRFVAFASSASNLEATDTNTRSDIFVRDLQTWTTTLVSVNTAGTDSGDHISGSPEISADGRFVAFSSRASDLVGMDTNGTFDIFVRDLQTGTTRLVSINKVGTDSGNHDSSGSRISADGRFVTFRSFASDLVVTDTNETGDVFIRDLQARTTTLVSVNSTGTDSGNSSSIFPEISAGGRFVAFGSWASDLVAADTNGRKDVFVRDLETGITTLVSVNSVGTDSGNGISENHVISADGRFVAFGSIASNLVTTDTNGGGDVFVFEELVLINDILDLNNVVTSFDPTPCRRTQFGTFTISATFSNISANNLSGISFNVVNLTGSNVLCNADGIRRRVGATLSVSSADLGEDGVLAPRESFTQDFDIGLNSSVPFKFFVDAFGVQE